MAKIINQYIGMTAEQVWDEWRPQQKWHFISDHIIGKQHTPVSLEQLWKKAYRFLPADIKETIKKHISEGQYESGGGFDEQAQTGTWYVWRIMEKGAKLYKHNKLVSTLSEAMAEAKAAKNWDVAQLYKVTDGNRKIIAVYHTGEVHDSFSDGGGFDDKKQEKLAAIKNKAEIIEKKLEAKGLKTTTRDHNGFALGGTYKGQSVEGEYYGSTRLPMELISLIDKYNGLYSEYILIEENKMEQGGSFSDFDISHLSPEAQNFFNEKIKNNPAIAKLPPDNQWLVKAKKAIDNSRPAASAPAVAEITKTEMQEAIALMKETLPHIKGAEKKEYKEAINLMKESVKYMV